MAVVPSPATTVNPGSSDCLPVTYPNPRLVTAVYVDPDPRRIPTYQTYLQEAPVWRDLDVRGPSTAWRDQAATDGLVNVKITQTNKAAQAGPIYVDVICDDVWYKIRVGATVTVPRRVYDSLAQSGTEKAIIVP